MAGAIPKQRRARVLLAEQPGHQRQASPSNTHPGVRLRLPTGGMHGTYQMARADGNQFDIEIAPFALKAKYAVN